MDLLFLRKPLSIVMPDNMPVVNKKRLGCLFFIGVLIVIWLFGFWYLWQASMNRPASQEKSESSSPFFEIIPGSDERTSVDDDMEDRGKADSTE